MGLFSGLGRKGRKHLKRLAKLKRNLEASMYYDISELLLLLRPFDPLKVEVLANTRRQVDHGLLSVGLKLHCLEEDEPIKKLIVELGGRERANANRMYRHEQSAVTFVLPPLGSARAAILLIECLESFFGYKIFNNPKFQIQVCSPGRLGPRYAAMLTIAFYLGSDLLRRYSLERLATTFSNNNQSYTRGRRIALYDGKGDLDQDFEWWDLEGSSLAISGTLPFESERTDILTCQTKVDIRNVNLLATLLVHHQKLAYWEHLGFRFVQEMEALLGRHLMGGILQSSWIHPADGTLEDDSSFLSAYQELELYVFQERLRLKQRHQWEPAKPPSGILYETRQLIDTLYQHLQAEAAHIRKERP